MIRTLLTLHVDPDRIDSVLGYYRSQNILQYSLDHSGALASEISVATDDSGEILITALWPDREAYEGWLNDPWRASSGEGLSQLLKNSEVGVGRIFSIDHEVRKNSPHEILALHHR